MPAYDPDKHHRRSIRLKGWDYTGIAVYFVTIVTHAREMLFGDIIDGETSLSRYGEIVKQEWLRSEAMRKEVELDEYVIMPNHLHGIIWIDGSSPPNRTNTPLAEGFFNSHGSLGRIMRGFKAASTSRINKLRDNPALRIWQRDYYDRIIRDDQELADTREYIRNNPLNWQLDEENPQRIR